MRDQLKSTEYFNEFIDKKEKSISKRNEKFKNNLIKQDRIKLVKRDMVGTYIAKVIAKYSRGDNMHTEDILDDYKNAIQLMYDNWEKNINNYSYGKYKKITYLNQYTLSGFINMMQIISLGILLDIPDRYIKMLSEIIDKDNIKDFLFEFLINQIFNNRISIEKESYTVFFHVNKRFSLLKEVIIESNKKIAERKINYFLEKKWYQSFKGTPLYNIHNNIHDTYPGYWCFIAAAIVKIKDLDDSSFKDNQYYPKDLV